MEKLENISNNIWKNILIFLLLIIVIWFGKTIIRLEEYHYSNQVHLCYKAGVDYRVDFNAYMEREKCLNTSHPRTSGLWNLYYALFN
jgi:hypothetical protein